MTNRPEMLYTHVIQIPPLTDIPELLGNYANLFSSMNVVVENFPFAAAEGFQHPMPDSQQVLLADFMNTLQAVQSLIHSGGSVKLKDVRVTNFSATFVFGYKE